MNEPLSEVNFLLYAAKNYDNPSCFDTLEFYEDLNRFKYIKKLFVRFQETGELKERLIINHLTIIYNVFGAEAATRMLFVKLENHLECLKPFLDLMGYLPRVLYGIGIANKTIDSNDIVSNPTIDEVLRRI